MSESFVDLFNESLSKKQMRSGDIVRGIVVGMDPEYVMVDVGLKSEGAISRDQFLNAEGKFEANIGDEVEVAIENVEDGFGETRLSREKARRAEDWTALTRAYESGENVTGIINGKVKGGFTVELASIRAFLPGSLVDVKPARDFSYLEGKPLEFKVIKLDKKRNNVVLSRRSIMEKEGGEDREAVLATLEEGQEVKGVVKNLTDYGAFVDLGGVDGLLHITDMSWKRIKHPSEVVSVGAEIAVKVLKFDRERNRVSLGLKQLGEDPWLDITRRYPENTRLFGRVTNIADYGCFVEIEAGVEGLVHLSEMDWTNRNVHPSKVVQVGDEVEVMVLDIDEERRRISLGIKQCMANPWEAFAQSHSKGDKIAGKIKSITDFGVFVGLDGNIDGLVHLSDLSWTEPGEVAVRNYKKGQDVEAIILAIDAERERISLGVKQLQGDSIVEFSEANPKGTIVQGKVVLVEADGAKVDLGQGVEGYVRVQDLTEDGNATDATQVVKVEDEITAKVVGVDKKARIINLSVRGKDVAEVEKPAKKEKKPKEVVAKPKLGDILKEHLAGKDTE